MSVLIAGAGPTGLTLACELTRRGVACRVLEKATGLFPGSRGKGLSPRTQEVFDDLGVSEAIRAGGMAFPPMRLYRGHTVVSERTVTEMLGVEPLTGDAFPYRETWMVPQWRTDAILRDRLVDLGGAVEFGTEVVGVEQDADGVRVRVVRDGWTEQIHADYLVAADGGRSTVRKALGVGFAGETFDRERVLVGDVRADGLDGVCCHVLTTAGDITERFSLWNLPHTPYYQFVARMPTEHAPPLTLAGVQGLLEERSGRTDVRLHDLRWISLYTVNARMVDRFRVGRVLLAGDAAHTHSPASGQGLNTSVQDAYNLGWKLAAVHRGADPGLLDSYEAERMPVAARLLGVSTALHHRNFRPGTGPAPDIHQLDIDYRDGPLATDDIEGASLRAGDRAPDALLDNGVRMFDLFRGPHFTLLSFGGNGDELAGADVHHHRLPPVAGYDVPEGALVLVRPDGHVGAISLAPQRIRDYLATVRGVVAHAG